MATAGEIMALRAKARRGIDVLTLRLSMIVRKRGDLDRQPGREKLPSS